MKLFFSQGFNHRSQACPEYLSQFEKNRVDVEEHTSTFYSMNKKKKRFMTLYFIIGKVLVQTLLADKKGLGVKISSKANWNLKIIGTIIYQVFITLALKLCPARDEKDDKEYILIDKSGKEIKQTTTEFGQQE